MTLLRIGTRKSKLALWQAEHIAGELRGHHPQLRIEFVRMTTKGDQFLSAPLAEVGGKGLFVREIEEALLRGEIDLAVHSLKDLPGDLPPGLVLAGPPPREDPRDVLVSKGSLRLAELPAGARVGTSSLRRAVQLRALRSDLAIVPVRGNVPTRLSKGRGEGGEQLSAVVLAAAGLRRLGLAEEIAEAFPVETFVPAVGQGILGLEHREGDATVAALVLPLAHAATAVAATAERALLARLGAGCHVPLGAHAQVGPDRLELQALVGDPDTGRCYLTSRSASLDDAAAVGRAVAEDLLSGPGGALLAH